MNLPNYLTQAASQYKANIDAAIAALAGFGGQFEPHQVASGSPAPDLAVEISAGLLYIGGSIISVPSQIVGGFTIPTSGQNRMDRIVINPLTGAASRVAGTAAVGSPNATAPAIPAGYVPCCKVYLTSSDTVVLDSMITDERSALIPMPATTLLGTNTISGSPADTAVVDFSTPTGYSSLILEWNNVVPNNKGAAVNLGFRYSLDGSAFNAAGGNYLRMRYEVDSGGVGAAAGDATRTYGTLAENISSGFSSPASQGGSSGRALFQGFGTTNTTKGCIVNALVADYYGVYKAVMIGVYMFSTAAEILALRLLLSTGNFESGTFNLYGTR